MRIEQMVIVGFVGALATSCTSSIVDSRSEAGSSAASSSASSSSSSGGDVSPKAPITLAEGLPDPSEIVADETSIYWSNRGTSVDGMYPLHDGSIVKLSYAGGGQVVLIDGIDVATIAADSAYVYWIDGKAIRRIAKTGGAKDIVAVDGETPHWLAVDATDVYWATSGGSIAKAPKQGGPITILSPPNEALNLRKIAVDATDVYCADLGDFTTPAPTGTLWKVAKSGGALVNIASAQAGPWAVAVDDGAVYWSTIGPLTDISDKLVGAVFKVAKSGGAPVLVADGQRTIYDLALAGGSLFWGNYASGPMLKVDAQSGVSTVVAADQTVSSVAVGPDFVYWVVPYANGGGMIRAAAR
ncbi:MAG: hypothetical protein ABJE95_30535 [Byssovorax sp.]